MKSFLFSGCCWCSSNQLRAPSAPGRATKYQLFETKSFSIPQLLWRRRGFKRSRDYVRDSGTSTRAANIILGQGLIINLVCHILPLATHCHIAAASDQVFSIISTLTNSYILWHQVISINVT